MTRDQCIKIIIDAYRQFAPREELAAPIGADTRLFGGDSPLDSTALVSLIIEVEQQVNETYGVDTVIADDRAMSQAHSPFRTVGSLADYIETLLMEPREG
jgi:acyl carrier protein